MYRLFTLFTLFTVYLQGSLARHDYMAAESSFRVPETHRLPEEDVETTHRRRRSMERTYNKTPPDHRPRHDLNCLKGKPIWSLK